MISRSHSNAKKSLWALWILTISWGLTGCGSGAVSENAARTAYEKSIHAIANGKVKLISFLKINGRKGESAGRKYYEVEYEAELEFLENYQPAMGLMDGMLKYKKGDVKKIRGWLHFEETEKGWRGEDGNVY